MPQLLDLPNETLRNTLEWVSEVDHGTLFKVSLVNKRLSSLAAPLLVRSWTGDWNTNLEFFLLHLLRHPEYRPEVRHLDLYPSTAEEARRDGYQSKISETEREELAAVAAEAWPELAKSTEFLTQVRGGVYDALIIILLTWAKDLRSLRIAVPHFDPADDEDLLTLMWVSQVVWKMKTLDESARDQLPLMKLEYVHFAHWDTENFVEHRLAAPFFHLPRVKSFFSHLMGDSGPWDDGGDTEQDRCWSEDYSEYLTTFPVGTSSVRSLQLGQADLSSRGLSDIIIACRSLESLTWELTPVLENEEMSSNKIASLLMHHAKSLTTVSLVWLEPPHFDTPHDSNVGETTMEACFHHLENLKELTAPWSLLLGEWTDGDEDTLEYLRLPPSIASLRPDSLTSQTKEDVVGILGQLEGMMERNPNLKEIDVSRILLKDEINDRLTQFRSSASGKGVAVVWKTNYHML